MIVLTAVPALWIALVAADEEVILLGYIHTEVFIKSVLF